MTANKVRSRIVTGCLVTMLLPVGVILAQSRIEPGFEPCSVQRDLEKDERPSLTFGDSLGVSPDQADASPGIAPAVVTSTSAAKPWFRITFAPFRTDTTCPVTAAERATSADPSAKAQLAAPKVKVPETVQNLRRADRQ